MHISMITNAPHLAEYALPPGIPALQTDPLKLQRSLVAYALALFCLAVSLGYLLGRSSEAGAIVETSSAQR